MGKRKFIEFMEQSPHTIHKFSTGEFSAASRKIIAESGPNQQASRTFHKELRKVPVEIAWKSRIELDKANGDVIRGRKN
jgi:hypothetical protein